MTIVEFLRARLAEDERAARAVRPLGHVFDMGGRQLDDEFRHSRITYSSADGYPQDRTDREAAAHFASHDPARVLAEVDAKRRIVDRIEGEIRALGPSLAATWVLHALALPYSDHPDYDESWRP